MASPKPLKTSAPLSAGRATALLDCVGRMHARGWCDGTSGNFSVSIGRNPLRLLITPSGLDKGSMSPQDLLVVDQDCRPIGAAPHRPSAETRLHVELVQRAGARAILHTHSTWGTLLGERFLPDGGLEIQGYEMLKGIQGITTHEVTLHVPVVPNSQDMAILSAEFARVLRARPESRGILIAGHGLYTWGSNLAEAQRHVEIFEFLFRLVGERVGALPWSAGSTLTRPEATQSEFPFDDGDDR